MVRIFKAEDPVVEISDGKVRGAINKNHDGGHFYAFLGIPYGKEPLGNLRFEVSRYYKFG